MNEVMPFAATWMALEGMMLVKSGGERQILYNTTYVWNLKTTKTSEQNKKEADSQIQRTSGSQRGREGGGATEGRGGGKGVVMGSCEIMGAQLLNVVKYYRIERISHSIQKKRIGHILENSHCWHRSHFWG